MAEGKSLVQKFFNVIKFNGGAVNTFVKLCRGIEPRMGTFMGEDQYGNKYFENKKSAAIPLNTVMYRNWVAAIVNVNSASVE